MAKPRKPHNGARRLTRLGATYGFESRYSWSAEDETPLFDIHWLEPMPPTQRLTTLRQIFKGVPPGTSLDKLEAAACQYAATQRRRWMVEIEIEYRIAQGPTRTESLDYWPDEPVNLRELSDYHRDTVANMLDEITEKSANAQVLDVIWRALPRPRKQAA